jgi:hypothetical protein
MHGVEHEVQREIELEMTAELLVADGDQSCTRRSG